VDVYNGGSTPGLAGQVSTALVKAGYKAGQVGNTSALTTTEVLYGAGSSATASKIASLFGVTATVSSTVAAGHVEVMLGANAAVPSASATPTFSSPAIPIPTTGAQGGAVHAKNGIPCVD
jgi:Na+-transporting NADH:ubiquinone oxidoreductase subunit NqrC